MRMGQIGKHALLWSLRLCRAALSAAEGASSNGEVWVAWNARERP